MCLAGKVKEKLGLAKYKLQNTVASFHLISYQWFQEMILELLHVFSGVMRGAIMPLSLDPDGQNFRNYHVWLEASLDQITPWLPQVCHYIG